MGKPTQRHLFVQFGECTVAKEQVSRSGDCKAIDHGELPFPQRSWHMYNMFLRVFVLSEKNRYMSYNTHNFCTNGSGKRFGYGSDFIEKILETNLHQLMACQSLVKSLLHPFIAPLFANHDNRFQIVGPFP
jgi:hypothetical protein